MTHLLTGSALATRVYSLVTDYELSAVKLLPMQAHLAFDAASGVPLCAAPVFLGEEEANVKAALAGLGLFEILASLTTESAPDAD